MILLAAAALADRGSLDTAPEYRARAWRAFTNRPVAPLGHWSPGAGWSPRDRSSP